MKITDQNLRRLAAESFTDLRTVKRMYDGEPTRRLPRERVIEAAKKLKLPAPPEVPVRTKEKRK